MTDTTKRDAVIERFMRHENDLLSWADMHAMADRIVELEAAVERQECILAADVQWLRQMLADYRVAYDDHPVGRRAALNVFIHSLRERAERAERILSALREPSEAIQWAMFEATRGWLVLNLAEIALRAALRVAAAEQEVERPTYPAPATPPLCPIRNPLHERGTPTRPCTPPPRPPGPRKPRR